MSFEDKYQKKTAAPEAPQSSAMEVLQAAATPAQEYKACNTTAHPEFELWLRPNNANEFTDVYVPYSFRTHMMSDGNGFVISMHYSTPIVSVVIHGRNLQELVHKLSKREVEWVMEHDAQKWAKVPEDEACITRIEITREPMVPGKDEDAEPDATSTPESTARH